MPLVNQIITSLIQQNVSIWGLVDWGLVVIWGTSPSLAQPRFLHRNRLIYLIKTANESVSWFLGIGIVPPLEIRKENVKWRVGERCSALFREVQLDLTPDMELFCTRFHRCQTNKREILSVTGATYKASHVLIDWVLLTWIWNVPPPCLGSR